MQRLMYILFQLTTYQKIRLKWPETRKLKFNGSFIAIFGKGDIRCDNDSYISYFTRVYIEKGTTLTIGSNVSIGHNVRIYTSSFDTKHFIKTGQKKNISGDVKIGNDVIISGNVYIGPSITIANRVIIGANSVVTRSILEPGVYAGSPARKLS